MLTVTCATGYASVFTIEGLYVACVEHCLGKGVSLESYLQAVGRKGINQPTRVSTRFLNLFAVTCATGYASVFTIGDLHVACVEHCLGNGVSLESYLQAFGRKRIN